MSLIEEAPMDFNSESIILILLSIDDLDVENGCLPCYSNDRDD